MRKVILILFILVSVACSAQVLSFSQPMYDTSTLPDASTTVLLHFDGDFTDVSGNIWTNGTWNGFNESFYKFGSAAGTDGQALSITQKVSYLTSTTATSSFQFGTGDYTIEFWVAFEVLEFYGPYSIGFQALLLKINGSPTATQFEFRPLVDADNSYTYVIRRQIYGNYSDTSAIGPLTGAEWIHLAFERVSGVSTIYVNGLSAETASDTYNINYAGITDVHLQAFTPANIGMNVYIDELRVMTGGYVYGGEFTPETHAFGVALPLGMRLSDGRVIMQGVTP